jgi:L-fuconolactonase
VRGNIKIIDPHIHLWDPYTTPRLITPLVKLLGRWPKLLDKAVKMAMPKATINFVGKSEYVCYPHLPDIYHRDTGKYNVDGYVHIQAGWVAKQPLDVVGETRWLMSLEDKPKAIVAEARLSDLDTLEALLDAHQEASSVVRGIRDMLACHDDKGVMDFAHDLAHNFSEDFKKGYTILGARGLTYDAFLYAHQLKAFRKIVSEFPDTDVVLDHLGTPVALAGQHGGVGATQLERDKIKADWYEDLAALAEVEHVMIKLSGLMMPVVGFQFENRKQSPGVQEVVDAMAPHITYAIKTFGVDRCMFASNFPMDKASVSYETLYDAFFTIVAGYSDEDTHKLFNQNASSFYRL